MKFASKLIHGGPVHPCYQPVEALQECTETKNKKQKTKNKQIRWNLKGRALHWPNEITCCMQQLLNYIPSQ